VGGRRGGKGGGRGRGKGEGRGGRVHLTHFAWVTFAALSLSEVTLSLCIAACLFVHESHSSL